MSLDTIQDAADLLSKEGVHYCIIAGFPGQRCTHVFKNVEPELIGRFIKVLEEVKNAPTNDADAD